MRSKPSGGERSQGVGDLVGWAGEGCDGVAGEALLEVAGFGWRAGGTSTDRPSREPPGWLRGRCRRGDGVRRTWWLRTRPGVQQCARSLSTPGDAFHTWFNSSIESARPVLGMAFDDGGEQLISTVNDEGCGPRSDSSPALGNRPFVDGPTLHLRGLSPPSAAIAATNGHPSQDRRSSRRAHLRDHITPPDTLRCSSSTVRYRQPFDCRSVRLGARWSVAGLVIWVSCSATSTTLPNAVAMRSSTSAVMIATPTGDFDGFVLGAPRCTVVTDRRPRVSARPRGRPTTAW